MSRLGSAALACSGTRTGTQTTLSRLARFDRICEAYDVLSNPLHRAIFDQYGEKGFKEGVADGRGGVVKGTGKYIYGENGDSLAIFVRVFGTDNPFAELFQVSKEFFDPSFVPPSTTAVVTNLPCTLEELMNGGIKVASVDLPVTESKTVDSPNLLICAAREWELGKSPSRLSEDGETELAYRWEQRKSSKERVVQRSSRVLSSRL
jgi:hypothetical protein